MKAIPLLAALAFAGALGGTAQAATGPSAAYFKVELSANQGVSWHLNYTSRICGGVSFTKGQGEATLRLHSTEPQIVTARRVTSPEKVALFVGRHGGGIPITGNVVRNGTESGGFTEPPTAGACRPPEPIPTDCGSRNYPRGSQVALHFDTPQSWDESFYGEPPLAQSLHLTGPAPVPVGLGFQNCPGERDDALLGLHDEDGLAMDSGFGGLPIGTIFGKRKHFTVTAVFNRTSHPHVMPPVMGTHEVNVALRWRVKFTRLAHGPGGN